MFPTMCPYFLDARGKVTGLVAPYVDGTMACGNRSFGEVTEKTLEAFEVKS